LKAAVQAPPAAVGIDLADWNWKVVRAFVQRQFGSTLSRSSCLNYLHRLDFVLKRPKKRLVKANAERRAAFVREYALLRAAAQASGAKLFFADEAHFYADVDLRGKWVLRGQPALVDSTSPRWGEKASYYSAVCLETGEVEVMELEGNSSAETSVAFLQQLRAHHPEPLIVIWDNDPAHGRAPLRAYFDQPGSAAPPGPLAGLQPRLQFGRARLGLGPCRSDRQYLLRGQSRSPRKWGHSSVTWPLGPSKSNAAAKPSSRPKLRVTPLRSTRSFNPRSM
jgi:hypothetical protein